MGRFGGAVDAQMRDLDRADRDLRLPRGYLGRLQKADGRGVHTVGALGQLAQHRIRVGLECTDGRPGELPVPLALGEHGALVVGALLLRDILVQRHPAFVRHRVVADADDPAVLQRHDRFRIRALGDDAVPGVEERIAVHRRGVAQAEPQLDQVAERHALVEQAGLDVVDLAIAAVPHDQPALAVEAAETLRDAVDGGRQLGQQPAGRA